MDNQNAESSNQESNKISPKYLEKYIYKVFKATYHKRPLARKSKFIKIFNSALLIGLYGKHYNMTGQVKTFNQFISSYINNHIDSLNTATSFKSIRNTLSNLIENSLSDTSKHDILKQAKVTMTASDVTEHIKHAVRSGCAEYSNHVNSKHHKLEDCLIIAIPLVAYFFPYKWIAQMLYGLSGVAYLAMLSFYNAVYHYGLGRAIVAIIAEIPVVFKRFHTKKV